MLLRRGIGAGAEIANERTIGHIQKLITALS